MNNQEPKENATRHYLADYHVHPGYSIDAAPENIRRYCLQARDAGLKEICFTTHLEHDAVYFHQNNEVRLQGQRVPSYRLHWLDEYFREIEEARQEFKTTGPVVKAGVEIGYSAQLEELIHRALQDYPFDFVLGAIHSVQGASISAIKECPEFFHLCSLEDLKQDYFGALENAVKSNFFDCLAHPDLYRRYGYEFYGPEILNMHRGIIEPILKEVAKRGMGLEINTSSLRRGLKEFHPSREILDMAVKTGVEIFTVGSDAHSLEELGDNIKEATLLLEQKGQNVYGFTRRRPYPLLPARRETETTTPP